MTRRLLSNRTGRCDSGDLVLSVTRPRPDLYTAARARARVMHEPIGLVLHRALHDYADGTAPPILQHRSGLPPLVWDVLDNLRHGAPRKVNTYLAQLHEAGWPMAMLAVAAPARRLEATERARRLQALLAGQHVDPTDCNQLTPSPGAVPPDASGLPPFGLRSWLLQALGSNPTAAGTLLRDLTRQGWDPNALEHLLANYGTTRQAMHLRVKQGRAEQPLDLPTPTGPVILPVLAADGSPMMAIGPGMRRQTSFQHCAVVSLHVRGALLLEGRPFVELVDRALYHYAAVNHPGEGSSLSPSGRSADRTSARTPARAGSIAPLRGVHRDFLNSAPLVQEER